MGFVYDEEVALRYDAAVPVGAGEVEFYLELAREAADQGLPTLELACGSGRIAVPLAREGGRLGGLDNSPAMLARAREKSAGLAGVEWVEGDMRAFDLGTAFGLAIIPAGSFQLLLTTADQIACLRCVCQHLSPGGRLAFALEHPNMVAMAEWLTQKRGTLQRRPQRDYRHPVTGNQAYSWGSVDYHPPSRRHGDPPTAAGQLQSREASVPGFSGQLQVKFDLPGLNRDSSVVSEGNVFVVDETHHTGLG